MNVLQKPRQAGRPTCSASKGSADLASHLDKEQPCVNHAAEETSHRGGDQPVQATTGLQQEGEPGHADEHGR